MGQVTVDTATFNVKVVPRANKNQIVGREGGVIKIRLNAPPVEGKANEALVKFLAEILGVHRTQIEIVTGHSSRHKIVRAYGVAADQIEKMIPK